MLSIIWGFEGGSDGLAEGLEGAFAGITVGINFTFINNVCNLPTQSLKLFRSGEFDDEIGGNIQFTNTKRTPADTGLNIN